MWTSILSVVHDVVVDADHTQTDYIDACDDMGDVEGTHIAEFGTTIWDLLVTPGMRRMGALYPLSMKAVVFYFL